MPSLCLHLILFSSEQVTFPNSLPVVWPIKQRLSLPASLSAAGFPENMNLWKCFVKRTMLRDSNTTLLGWCRDSPPPLHSWFVHWAHVDGDLIAGGGLFPLQLAPLNPATLKWWQWKHNYDHFQAHILDFYFMNIFAFCVCFYLPLVDCSSLS